MSRYMTNKITYCYPIENNLQSDYFILETFYPKKKKKNTFKSFNYLKRQGTKKTTQNGLKGRL